MPIPIAIPIIAAVAALTSKGVGLYQGNKSAKEQAAYVRRVREAQEREARRETLRRLLRGPVVDAFSKKTIPQPDFARRQLRAGLANYFGDILNTGAAMSRTLGGGGGGGEGFDASSFTENA